MNIIDTAIICDGRCEFEFIGQFSSQQLQIYGARREDKHKDIVINVGQWHISQSSFDIYSPIFQSDRQENHFVDEFIYWNLLFNLRCYTPLPYKWLRNDFLHDSSKALLTRVWPRRLAYSKASSMPLAVLQGLTLHVDVPLRWQQADYSTQSSPDG